MEKISLFKLTGLPDSFGAVLLIFSFVLFLSPYFAGADFGVFKIPRIAQPARKWLKMIGPIAFVLCALSFLPFFSPSPSASVTPIEAQNVGVKWFAAVKRRDVSAIIEMADFPFYFDRQILAGPVEMRQRFQEVGSKPGGDSSLLELKSVKVKTIAQWKKDGYDAERDRLLSSIAYNDDDFFVILMVVDREHQNEEGIVLHMRRVGGELKVAGTWD